LIKQSQLNFLKNKINQLKIVEKVMITIHKIVFTALISCNLIFTACSDKTTDTMQNKVMEGTPATTAQGNWRTKASELTSANPIEIKADLAQLNQVVNHANTQALQLRAEIQSSTKQQPEKIKQILLKSNEIQKDVQQQIMALNFKSREVQSIRTQMIDNLIMTQKMYALSTSANFDVNTPNDEFKQLAERSVALQQKISTEMEALNRQYEK
jgi:hypothetical protein